MPFALAILSGALYFLGFVGFGYFPLTWFCLVPVLFAVKNATPRRALAIGTVFGFTTNAGGYYWVIHLMEEFARVPLVVAVLGYALLCLYQGFLLALVIWFVRRMRHDFGIAPVWSMTIGFVGLELAYPLLFPSYIGNSQYRFVAVTQIVDLFGMPALTALICLVNGAIYEVIEARLAGRPAVRSRNLVAVVTFALAIVYGLIRMPMIDRKVEEAKRITVAIVQTNLGARDKEGRRDEFIRRHQDMTIEAIHAHPEIELVVWPESAYNEWIPRSTKNLAERVTRGVPRPVIFGALTHGRMDSYDRETYNSAVLTSASGDVLGIYDKSELLSFGETLPLADTFPFYPRWFHFLGFTRGRNFHPFVLDGVKLAPNICYEDIIPTLVRRFWTTSGPADALVNVTNDSWYGNTHEPLIHLVLASFRSIETRRALIRSTNTGISAIVDPVGRITQRTGQWTQEVLIAKVPLIQDGSTTLYEMTGDVFGWTMAVLFFLLVISSWRARRRRR